MDVQELRLKLAAAERAAEAADRNVRVNYWRDKEIAKRDRARARVAELGNRLAELESQGALRL